MKKENKNNTNSGLKIRIGLGQYCDCKYPKDAAERLCRMLKKASL